MQKCRRTRYCHEGTSVEATQTGGVGEATQTGGVGEAKIVCLKIAQGF